MTTAARTTNAGPSLAASNFYELFLDVGVFTLSFMKWTQIKQRRCTQESNPIGLSSNRGIDMKTTPLLLAVMTFALNLNAGTDERLAVCRQQIDTLDQRIVELIQERARVVADVGDIKREAHLPVTVPGREKQVIERAQELAKAGPLPAEAVGRIYQRLIEEMRNWEAKPGTATPLVLGRPAYNACLAHGRVYCNTKP